MFLDHTQRRTTVGRNPLDEWSARRRDLYLTTHNTHNRQISMPPVGFKPTISAGERPQAAHLLSRPARPRPTTLLPPRSNGKPEATTAVIELLMMGVRMSETCWAVFKRQVINLRNCCIWLVDSFEWESTKALKTHILLYHKNSLSEFLNYIRHIFTTVNDKVC